MAKQATKPDSLCTCGALQSEHDPSPMGSPGHGPNDDTDCDQFTWERFSGPAYQETDPPTNDGR